MSDMERGVFTDALGREWHPVYTTPVVMKTCRELDLTLAKLLSANLNLADLFDSLWYACEADAKASGISREQFFEERLTPAVMPSAIAAWMTRIQDAFPQAEGGTEGGDPFGLGSLMTSLNSAHEQVSAPPKPSRRERRSSLRKKGKS